MTDTPRSKAAEAVESNGRAQWMGLLARASECDLEAGWQALAAAGEPPAYALLRAPEKGLVMVRGRVGGDGAPFNLGEMSVTRCAVRLDGGAVGHGYVAGRSARHAELAAVFDGLLQTAGWAERVQDRVLTPIRTRLALARAQSAARTAATRVEFFTLVREQTAEQE